jgi:hypothetical protein
MKKYKIEIVVETDDEITNSNIDEFMDGSWFYNTLFMGAVTKVNVTEQGRIEVGYN